MTSAAEGPTPCARCRRPLRWRRAARSKELREIPAAESEARARFDLDPQQLAVLAAADAERAATLAPGAPEPFVCHGAALSAIEDFAGAQRMFAHALSLDPSNEAAQARKALPAWPLSPSSPSPPSCTQRGPSGTLTSALPRSAPALSLLPHLPLLRGASKLVCIHAYVFTLASHPLANCKQGCPSAALRSRLPTISCL